MLSVGGKSAAGDVGAAEGGIKSLAGTAKMAAGAAGLGALAFGIKDVVKAGMDWQAQQTQLAGALKNTGQYSADTMHRLSDAAERLATHGGFDPGQNISTMTRLIAAHTSVNEAMKDTTLVSDIARRSGLSYQTALRAVIQVEQGRTTGLSRLGVVIKPVTTAQNALTAAHQSAADKIKALEAAGVKFTAQQKLQFEMNNRITPQMKAQAKEEDAHASRLIALRELTKRFGGASAEYAKTAAGAMSDLKNQVVILTERLGAVLLPILALVAKAFIAILGPLADLVTAIGKNKDLLIALGIALGVTAGVWAVLNAETLAYQGIAALATAATWAQNAAMAVLDAETLALIGVFVLLVAGIYLLIKHWKQVKEAALDAWHWILGAIKAAWNWIKQNWPLILGMLTGPIGLAVAFIVTHWKLVLSWLQSVWNWIKGVWSTVGSILLAPFSWAWNKIKGLFGWLGGQFNNVLNFIKGTWQTLKDFIEKPFKAAFGIIKSIYDNTIGKIVGVVQSIVGGGTSARARTIHTPAVRPSGAGSPAMVAGARQAGGWTSGGGFYDVGEQGREMVYLPPQTYVMSNKAMQALENLVKSGFQAERGAMLETTAVFKVGEVEFARAMQRSLATVKSTR
jgi:hypothetical protein